MPNHQMLIEVFHEAGTSLSKTYRRAWGERRVDVSVWHCAMVSSTRSNNRGVEFTLKGGPSQVWEARFWFTPRALFRLVSFAKACGITAEMARSYDIWSLASHLTLLHRELAIAIVPGGKRYEVVNWWPIGEIEVDPRWPLNVGGFAVSNRSTGSKNIPGLGSE
ncbi:MAG TPA: hypothetical protein PKN33_21260 [Phycisphaerae bacterium]|nr:hypothetical protein [Phycisphaerae bacterium]